MGIAAKQVGEKEGSIPASIPGGIPIYGSGTVEYGTQTKF